MSAQTRILVTTGESRTGDYVVQNLLDPKSPCKAYVQDVSVIYPEHLTSETLKSLDAKLIHCNCNEASVEDLRKLVTNAAPDTLVIIPPASADKEDVTSKYLEATKTAIEAKELRSVKNVVMLSVAGAADDAPDEIKRFKRMEDKAKECLKDLNIHCCVVRTCPYFQNHLLYVKQMYHDHFLGTPLAADDKITMLDARDAGAAVAILAGCTDSNTKEMGERHRNKTYTIASPEVLTFQQMVDDMISEIPDLKSVLSEGPYKQIDRKQAEEYLSTVKELDRCEAMVLQDTFELAKQGKLAEPTKDLQQLFGEQGLEPRNFKEFVKEYAKEFSTPVAREE